jgi:hypothetical protein
MRNRRKTVHSCFILLALWALLGGLGGPKLGLAAEVEVRAQLSDTVIYLGDTAELEVRVSGIPDPKPMTLEVPGIEISHAGDQRFNNSSITIINGRTTRVEDVGYVARYHLQPQHDGTFRIPAITMSHEGETYQSQPLSLTVKKPDAQDYLLVQVTTDKTSYVLGERVTLTLDLSLRKLTLNGRDLEVDPFFPKQPPHLQIPWFEGLGDWKTAALQDFVQPFLNQRDPGFYINEYVDQRSFFGRDRIAFTLPRQTTRRTRPSGAFSYFTYRLQKTFHPIRAGAQTIPPVLVKATLPTEIDARNRVQASETVVASSEPLSVTIHPVPSANQPDSFNGGVGRFELSADATPTALKVGDPLTLTLTVQGEPGSLLETVRPLALHEQADLTRAFKVPADPPAVKTANNAKIFTYTLRPRQADVQAIPPIEMAYYNPDSKRFERVQSDPIALRVEGAAALDTSDVIVIEDRPPKSRLGRELAEGLLANYTGSEVLVPQQNRLRFTPLMGAVLIVPPVAYLLTLFGQQWTRQRRLHPERQRSKQAARVALSTLHRLKTQANGDDVHLCEGIHRALTGYIRDKLDLSHAGLTVDDVTQHLRTRGVEASLIDQTHAIFHLCDNARYAPGNLAVAQRTGLIEDAERVIRHLEDSAQL